MGMMSSGSNRLVVYRNSGMLRSSETGTGQVPDTFLLKTVGGRRSPKRAASLRDQRRKPKP